VRAVRVGMMPPVVGKDGHQAQPTARSAHSGASGGHQPQTPSPSVLTRLLVVGHLVVAHGTGHGRRPDGVEEVEHQPRRQAEDHAQDGQEQEDVGDRQIRHQTRPRGRRPPDD